METEAILTTEGLESDQIKALKDRFNLQNDPHFHFAGKVCIEIARNRLGKDMEAAGHEMPVGDALADEIAQRAIEAHGFLRESLESGDLEEWHEQPLFGLPLEQVVSAVEAVDARQIENRVRHG